MRFDRLFKRTLTLVYGDQSGTSVDGPIIPFVIRHTDEREDLRIVFRITRTTTGDADRARIDVYNLPDNLAKSMRRDLNDLHNLRRDAQERAELTDQQRAESLKSIVAGYRVGLFAGYQGRDQLIFRGDLIKVTLVPSKGSGDTVTQIELGDTLYALRDSYLKTTFGSNTFVATLMEASIKAMAVEADEATAKVFLTTLLPNARIARLKNGWAGTSRAAENINEFAAIYGLQWWVKEDIMYFANRGSVLDDFAVVLTQGIDLLGFTQPSDYGDLTGRGLLNPNIVPGRGLILIDQDGDRIDELGFRVNTIRARGDTHGVPWYVDFECSGVESRVLSPSVTFDSEGYEIGAGGSSGLEF